MVTELEGTKPAEVEEGDGEVEEAADEAKDGLEDGLANVQKWEVIGLVFVGGGLSLAARILRSLSERE